MPARLKKKGNDPRWEVEHRLTAIPLTQLKPLPVRATHQASVLSYHRLAMRLQVVKLPANTPVDQSRCTSRAMVRSSLATRILPTVRASKCTNNVIVPSCGPSMRFADLFVRS